MMRIGFFEKKEPSPFPIPRDIMEEKWEQLYSLKFYSGL